MTESIECTLEQRQETWERMERMTNQLVGGMMFCEGCYHEAERRGTRVHAANRHLLSHDQHMAFKWMMQDLEWVARLLLVVTLVRGLRVSG